VISEICFVWDGYKDSALFWSCVVSLFIILLLAYLCQLWLSVLFENVCSLFFFLIKTGLKMKWNVQPFSLKHYWHHYI
jgi:hypothetical protein